MDSDYSVLLEKRETLKISKATDVLSFTDNKVVLRLCDGSVVISGKDLHIRNFSSEEETIVEGRINALTFSEHKGAKSLFKKCVK